MNSMPQRDPELAISLSNKLCKNSGCLIDSVLESVTGQRSNQLNYVPTRQINEMRNRLYL